MSVSLDRDFTHVGNFTGYMAVVERYFARCGRSGLRVLDMPAGNGILAQRLRQLGHQVVCGDINAEQPDYAFVNMEQHLPFDDQSFDAVSCLEGIEHVVAPDALVSEICRIVRPDGFVVLSLPNVQSFYSRLQFLLTGTFYQFEPEGARHPRGQMIDRGHISALTLVQLNYLFGEHGFTLQSVDGDRIKKKILLPLYAVLGAFNYVVGRLRSRHPAAREVTGLYTALSHWRCMTSRSLVTVWART